jgi:hypothetical protein
MLDRAKDLVGADLRWALLDHVDLREADFTGAVLAGVNLEGALLDDDVTPPSARRWRSAPTIPTHPTTSARPGTGNSPRSRASRDALGSETSIADPVQHQLPSAVA